MGDEYIPQSRDTEEHKSLAYVPQGTEEYNRTYFPRNLMNISPFLKELSLMSEHKIFLKKNCIFCLPLLIPRSAIEINTPENNHF
jgi:hypothetical protein